MYKCKEDILKNFDELELTIYFCPWRNISNQRGNRVNEVVSKDVC